MKKTNENGITLIALVVTIVVLLILAGITITYVLADDGIFSSARDAKVAAKKAAIQDYASQIQGNALIAHYADKDLTLTDVKTLQTFFPEGYTVKEGSGSNMKFTEGTDGKPGKVTGNFTVVLDEEEYVVTFDDKGVCTVGDPTKAST